MPQVQGLLVLSESFQQASFVHSFPVQENKMFEILKIETGQEK